jgi:hypothetical protein
VAGERADVGPSTVGVVGERLGTSNRWGRRDREGSERAGEINGADRPSPRGRERGSEGSLELAPTGGARLSGTEVMRARARARWA